MNQNNTYWTERESSIYLYTVRELVKGLAVNANSMIDVGSAGCPYLDWYDWIPDRTSIDLRRPYKSNNIKSITGDFLTWNHEKVYDVCTCLQVLEHVPLVEEFAQKLLDICNILIVSVPYKWRFGSNISHVHDPVDEKKMLLWFNKSPNFSIVIKEVKSDSRRLICIYEKNNEIPWISLNQRKRNLQAIHADDKY